MKISDMKKNLAGIAAVNFKLPDGSYLPSHFHVTEVGLVTKHFIDCGGVEKFLHILALSQKILGNDDLNIEVEYQQNTICKFGLDFDGKDFILTAKQTACLAQNACGIPGSFRVRE